jgi:hypothetical protein
MVKEGSMRPQYHIWLIGALCSIAVLAVGGLVSALESRGLDPLGWSDAVPSATLAVTTPPTATPTPMPAPLPPSVTAAPHPPKATEAAPPTDTAEPPANTPAGPRQRRFSAPRTP